MLKCGRLRRSNGRHCENYTSRLITGSRQGSLHLPYRICTTFSVPETATEPRGLAVVIWIIGLSGAGKITLGRELARQWRLIGSNCVLLDGDELRDVFGHNGSDAAYAVSGRRMNAERMTALCTLLDRQGVNVVC